MQNHAALKHEANVVTLKLIAESAKRLRLRFLALVISGTLPIIALSDAVAESPEAIVTRHLSAINSGDLDAAVAVYADSAIFITPDGETKGKTAIRYVLAGVLATVRGDSAGSRALIAVKQKYFTKTVGFIVWTQNTGKPGEVQGSDTFVVRRGKIILQTAFLVPIHGPAN
jgi:hypothetical protein